MVRPTGCTTGCVHTIGCTTVCTTAVLPAGAVRKMSAPCNCAGPGAQRSSLACGVLPLQRLQSITSRAGVRYSRRQALLCRVSREQLRATMRPLQTSLPHRSVHAAGHSRSIMFSCCPSVRSCVRARACVFAHTRGCILGPIGFL